MAPKPRMNAASTVAAASGPGHQRARRSHAERRAETIDLIINATIETITEVGLRNASSGEICRRAGVSPGAMFHHFDTQLDVIVAAVEHHLAGRLDRYSRYIESRRSGATADPRALIRLLRSIWREPPSMVWLETVMETRTNAELRSRLAPVLQRQREIFRAIAAVQPGLNEMPVAARNAWLELLRNVLHGEAIREYVMPDHDLDELKTDVLLALARRMGAAPQVSAQ